MTQQSMTGPTSRRRAKRKDKETRISVDVVKSSKGHTLSTRVLYCNRGTTRDAGKICGMSERREESELWAREVRHEGRYAGFPCGGGRNQ